ncbi:hypothetical protein Tco_0377220 [Tanacetum coccineum]
MGDRPSWSGTRLYADCVPCGTAKLLLFAPVCGLCSLRNGEAHAPCGRVQIRLLAEQLALGTEVGFKPAFHIYVSDAHDTFGQKLSHNMDQLQRKLEKENLHECETKTCFKVLITQFETLFTSKKVDSSDHDSQDLIKSFKYYTCKEPQTYRREIIYYMDGLEMQIDKRAFHDSE